MSGLATGVVGISPAGALGVAFYHYLSRELSANADRLCLVDRTGSSSAAALRRAGALRIQGRAQIHEVPLASLCAGTLVEAHAAGRLPAVLLVCANPDQLFGYVSDYVALLEALHAQGKLCAAGADLPFVVLLANGIYYQRVRQVLIEKVEESTLLGRLPDLWPDVMPRIVGHWLRGVTMQTALRDGSGARAVYRPGPQNGTTVAGGDAAGRAGVCALLTGLGGRFEDAGSAPPTRVEFLKAFVNLNSNLLGLIRAIDDAGVFRPLQLKEIYTEAFRAEATTLIGVVFEIGRAVNAFTPADTAEAMVQRCFQIACQHPQHVPSSLQWVEQELAARRLRPEVPPTESWLLNPLLHYARSSGLVRETQYLESLRDRLVERLGLAAARQ